MPAQIDELVAELQSRVDPHLRGVYYGDFEDRDYRIAYSDGEPAPDYTAEEIDVIVEDVSFKQLDYDRKGAVHEPLGDYLVDLEVYETGINVIALGYDAPTILIGLDGDPASISPAVAAVDAVLGDD
ncbi:hypothetical protein [Salinirubrum litoreum]|uniref:Uncharacterized protein n=1 Tax=Salinirubrum litoreum TaxID=1126234 RepID=A0ABD5RCM5_9EURY|nr:hypothetical protein [Salinirubrum litoreum]